MIIKVDTVEEMEQLKAESEYIHYLECIDSDLAPSLMHIYNMPDTQWEVKELMGDICEFCGTRIPTMQECECRCG